MSIKMDSSETVREVISVDNMRFPCLARSLKTGYTYYFPRDLKYAKDTGVGAAAICLEQDSLVLFKSYALSDMMFVIIDKPITVTFDSN